MSIVLTSVFAVGLSSICGHLGAERRRHNRNVRAIGTRILVNGIRGKSSTTRLVAAGLRADPGNVVAAKTTGTAARMIYPNGHETPIERRHGIVNVIEQVDVVAVAAKLRATHLVLECMAVDPELQRLNQEVLVQSQIGVITNVRMDHVDEMGPTLRDIARSLSGGMPIGGICVTAEDRVWRTLRREAEIRDCELVYADPDAVTDAEMAGFPYLTFKGNVACALKVAELCGVPREIALSAMYVADPDPGVLRVDAVQHQGQIVRAANLFAANDPESTVDNLLLLRERGMVRGRLSVVINCRPDRVERNGQMGSIVEAMGADRVFLIGAPTRSALHTIPEQFRSRVVDLEGEQHTGAALREQIFARLFDDLDQPDETIVMVGNIHGRGEELLHALDEQAMRVDPSLAATRDLSAHLRVPVGVGVGVGESTVRLPAMREPVAVTRTLTLAAHISPFAATPQQHGGPYARSPRRSSAVYHSELSGYSQHADESR